MLTVVAFHAHPDDEVLWTGGTLARAACAGHRVVVAVATDGYMGDGRGSGARVRLDELDASAAVLGVARVVHLGYADSGHGPILFPDPPDRPRFARADLDEAAGRLAELLREERADVLISYDAQGGYGHRDHVKVHEVGARAAELVGTVRVLEATLPREPVERVLRIVRLPRLPGRPTARVLPPMFTPRREITYRVDVRRFARQKQAALAVHRSQVNGTSGMARLRWVLTRLPTPVFGLLLGREWFTSPGGPGAGPDTSHGGIFDRAR